ncbi:MAG: wax ester/triacylglycerol synthase family O-acyltransferase, partial [Nocardioides sp.]|uniref:wax ester/triacylglycerol synthase domain-containing protein n=1 Tax=Nocardioides sp. TaxID=35761 RepID=UPI0039E5C112
MGDRLTPRDLAFLTEERPTAPRHNATVEVFEPGPSGFRYDELLALVADRLSFVPRYRQKVQFVPGRVANPVWVDDPTFDLEYHVRLSALPRPGSHDQLRDLVGRIVARPLDRERPLWEMYLIEGLEGGRFAILAKAHQALVDGVETIDLGQLLLDLRPDTALTPDDHAPAVAGRRPTAAGLLLDVVRDALTDGDVLLDSARSRGFFVARAGRRTARRMARATALVTRRRPERP